MEKDKHKIRFTHDVDVPASLQAHYNIIQKLWTERYELTRSSWNRSFEVNATTAALIWKELHDDSARVEAVLGTDFSLRTREMREAYKPNMDLTGCPPHIRRLTSGNYFAHNYPSTSRFTDYDKSEHNLLPHEMKDMLPSMMDENGFIRHGLKFPHDIDTWYAAFDSHIKAAEMQLTNTPKNCGFD